MFLIKILSVRLTCLRSVFLLLMFGFVFVESAVAQYGLSGASTPLAPAVQPDGLRVHRPLTIDINKSQLIYMHEPFSALIIGNPDIADISVHSEQSLILVGRRIGVTNLIVTNKANKILLDVEVHVGDEFPSGNVRLYNGSAQARQTYRCTPYCLPAPSLGDEQNFINANRPAVSVTDGNDDDGILRQSGRGLPSVATPGTVSPSVLTPLSSLSAISPLAIPSANTSVGSPGL